MRGEKAIHNRVSLVLRERMRNGSSVCKWNEVEEEEMLTGEESHDGETSRRSFDDDLKQGR